MSHGQLDRTLRAHNWHPPKIDTPRRWRTRIGRRKANKKVWALEEIENWELRPISDGKEPPLDLEELQEIADRMLEVELEYDPQ